LRSATRLRRKEEFLSALLWHGRALTLVSPQMRNRDRCEIRKRCGNGVESHLSQKHEGWVHGAELKKAGKTGDPP